MKLSDTLMAPMLGRQPEGSKDEFTSLFFTLGAAKSYVAAFEAALDLFGSTQASASATSDRAEARRYRAFAFIAARDGAMSLYHYSKVAEHCGTLGNKLAEQSVYFDRRTFKVAKLKFRQAFPHVVNIRNAVGHSAEITGEEHDRHVIKTEVEKGGFVKKGSGQLFIMNSLSGSEFINTYMGKLISYNINLESLTTLVECCRGLFAAFEQPKTPPMRP